MVFVEERFEEWVMSDRVADALALGIGFRLGQGLREGFGGGFGLIVQGTGDAEQFPAVFGGEFVVRPLFQFGDLGGRFCPSQAGIIPETSRKGKLRTGRNTQGVRSEDTTFRPDALIGKRPTVLRGDQIYNGSDALQATPRNPGKGGS